MYNSRKGLYLRTREWKLIFLLFIKNCCAPSDLKYAVSLMLHIFVPLSLSFSPLFLPMAKYLSIHIKSCLNMCMLKAFCMGISDMLQYCWFSYICIYVLKEIFVVPPPNEGSTKGDFWKKIIPVAVFKYNPKLSGFFSLLDHFTKQHCNC